MNFSGPKPEEINQTADEIVRPAASVTFFRAIKNYYVNFSNFKGRAVRSEYWWVFLYGQFISITFWCLPDDLKSLSFAWSIVHLIPGIALMIRRLHDTGRSGKYWFVNLIPIFGTIAFIFLLTEGSDEDNEWGLSPHPQVFMPNAGGSGDALGENGAPVHKWRCMCGNMIAAYPCPHCGYGGEPKEEIPDGYWKCRGCGEYVSLEKEKCKCGYKRT